MLEIGDDYGNVIDEGTRFQLASVISRERKIEDARRDLERLSKSERKSSNVRWRGLLNNNLVERLHGTLRDREKVMRGLKIENTPIINGHMIYYNFIRRI